MRLSPGYHRRNKKRIEDGSDPELGLVYYLFHTKGWKPDEFYLKPPGFRDLVAALASYEIDHRPGRR